ncbi:DUF4982 domain-containing protein [Pelagicoccus sp. NFK12]|uniref:DUF4982 domain-containing protein n=1 Tax=Pelagicoccus enzymogenes TaxID=2773457 RepID=A0A927F6H0_9BACT|nr:glycoside hydrolase family 2 TIM barrel-domain containing protein [Pelagicoccus enzymogenes]MBD5778055.1 DUF4982 domain-containing protein [Pelagicoccus enzymogenes]
MMKKILPILCCVVLASTAFGASEAALNPNQISLDSTAVREQQTFDFGWRFSLGDEPEAKNPGFDDESWRSLDLPHDWSIEGPYDKDAPSGGSGGYLPTGVGWYRKTFTLPDEARGKQARIQFDGVYQNSTVWINGHELGTRPFGYATFHYDLTPHLNYGSTPNVIAVRVDNSDQPNSRWYSGSGIYRHTWLTITDPLAVAPFGVYVTTPEVSAEAATVHVQTSVRNERSEGTRFTLHTSLLGSRGEALAQNVEEVSAPSEIAAGGELELAATLQVPTPRLWSPDTPELYRARSELRVDDVVVDAVETTFGIRELVYDVDRGLLINGEQVKLRGMCLHEDGGAVGAAVPEAVLERRLRLLMEMGCNAVRASHNPMAPEFYELCDRLGMLVMDEVFDEWTVRKPQIKFGYSDIFEEWFERDVVDFVRRDRNHPSIVMWSAGNEIGEQRSEVGIEVLGKLIEIFHREDPTRPVTAGLDNVFNGDGRAPEAFTELLDVVGYNYPDRWGDRRELLHSDDRRDFPERKFVHTESTTARGTRGEYTFGPLLGGGFSFSERRVLPGKGPEAALYLDDTVQAERIWRFVSLNDYVIGDFGWTGIDYLGEARWPRKGASPGPLDTCGFKKDQFYFYQSIWTSDPMVHLLPHWNWPDRVGEIVPVVAYTNCAVVELFLNGRSLGPKSHEFPAQGAEGGWASYAKTVIRPTTGDMKFVWDVPYEPGELKAVGYDRDGNVVVTEFVRTAGDPAKLEVTIDRASIAADARDVAHVTVRAFDANGVFVPLADNQLTFELSGVAKLIGVDNGDLANHDSYQSNERPLYYGMALALLQSTLEPGEARLVVSSPGLPDASVSLAIGD